MKTCVVLVFCAILFAFFPQDVLAVNPYLPLWERMPDIQPRVFSDPDNPGQYRLYVIGSHDTRFVGYCGFSIKAWSAPVDDLTNWRDEGPIFTYQAPNGLWDIMFAPDLVEVRHRDGTLEYFLFPHSRGPGREAMVASGPSPTGPFTILNLEDCGTRTITGSIIGFDPHVFIEQIDDPQDPDYEIGFRAFAYWGFQRSFAAELDQSTMWSVRPGTQVIQHFIPSSYTYGVVRDAEGLTFPHVFPGEDLTAFNYFEAKAVRRLGNKFILTYAAHSGPDYGLPSSSSTMRYAFGDSPLGPWRAGGILVDSRAPVLNHDGSAIIATGSAHNTHGSLQLINDQWYVFFHRSQGGFGYARQPMVAPVMIEYDDIPVAQGGRVRIRAFDPFAEDGIWTARASNGMEFTGAQVTSEGFQIFGLPPYRYYSAGIASYMTRSAALQNSWDIWHDHMSLINLVNGDRIGFFHFGFAGLDEYTKGLRPFEGTAVGNNTQFSVWLTPRTNEAFTVNVWLDGPWDTPAWNGTLIGQIEVPANAAPEITRFTIDVSQYVDHLDRKHAIFIVPEGNSGHLLDLIGLGFSADHIQIERPVPPSIYIYVNGEEIGLPQHPVRSTPENGILFFDIYEQTVAKPLDTIRIPEITARSSDANVGIEIIQAYSPFSSNASVAFDYNGMVKTYRIIFTPQIIELAEAEIFYIAQQDPIFEGTARIAWEDVIGGFNPAGTMFQGVTSTVPGAVSFIIYTEKTGFYHIGFEYVVHGGDASIIFKANAGSEFIYESTPQGWVHGYLEKPLLLNRGENIITIRHDSGLFEARSLSIEYVMGNEFANLWAQVSQGGVITSLYENNTATAQTVTMVVGVYDANGVMLEAVSQTVEVAPGLWEVLTMDISRFRAGNNYFRAFALNSDFAPLAKPAQGFIE